MKLKHLYILYKNNIAYMKYLKKFEHFSGHDSHPDLGNRFTNEPEEVMSNVMPEEEEEVMPEYGEENCSECGYNLTDCECGGNYEEKEKEENQGTWGDEENNPLMIEKKNNKGFKAFLDKQKAKKEDKKETTKKETTYDKSGLKHPEKADLNKNKKISGYEKVRGKAIQNAVQDEKEEKGSKDKKEAKETKKKK
jgi:hypothetical protein